MPYRNGKVIRITCNAILLFILAGIIHTMDFSDSNIFLEVIKTIGINIIYTGLALFWGISLHQRVMQKNILHYLQIMDAGIVLWMILRYVKYEFFVGTAARYLWYLYYLPQIIVPLVLFYCVLSIGRRENESIDRKWYLLLIPACVLFIGIMTNDFHNLAFKFQPGMRDWSSEYSYGILYFMIMLWMMGLVIISLIIIYRKCKVCCSRRKAWIPVGVFIVGTIIGITQLLGMQNFYNIPEILCTSYSEDTLTITNKYVPDPVIIIPTNPPLKPLEPTVEPTEEPSVEPSEEPTEDVTVVPTENPNAPGDSEDEVRDDDSKEEVVKPETSKHLQAPVTSDKETTDAQNGNDDTPKTSDDNNMMLYCLYMLLSATGIVVVYSRKRKNKA